MAVEKSYARLGLFVVVVVLTALATAVFFVQRVRRQAVIGMVTYTTDNVSGLDVSSPVRYRGVAVGQVTEVRVDPRGDIAVVEVDFDLFLDRLNTIGVNVKRIRQFTDLGGMLPNLRAQVVGNPVTGEAYLLLDVPKNPPPPLALGFTPDRPYVASVPSMMGQVQDRLPEVLNTAQETLQTLREIVARVPSSLDRSDRFFTNIERIFRESDLQALSTDSRKFFSTTTAQMERMTNDLQGLVGAEGPLVTFAEEARTAMREADLPAASRSSREAMERTSLAADDLRRSLPAIRQSLDELRDLARQIQDQPESVMYGPRPPATGKKR
jgi:ABC-type transporter Mla subunit MlaD